MTVKPEVKELFVELRQEKVGSKRWNEIVEVLKKQYKFTAWNILAAFGVKPAIEYNDENMMLVLED